MKKNIKLAVIVIIVTLSLLLQACNMKKDFIAPMQEFNGINSQCSVIC